MSQSPKTLQIPQISILHLDPITARILMIGGDSNPWVRCAEWEHGLFLLISELDDSKEPVPACLQGLHDWIKSRRGLIPSWVHIDQDGDQVSGLKNYAEEWAKT